MSREKKNKIYCANCANCRIFRMDIGNNQYQLRVKCLQGKWKKKSGSEKVYKYFTVARRVMDECDGYEPMGDPLEYIKKLKKQLPVKDEVYNYPEPDEKDKEEQEELNQEEK